MHALSVAFRPEDLARLTGVRGTALMDGIAPLAEVASRAFLDACLSVFEGSDAGPFARVENALAPLWRDARPAAPAPFLGEWLRGLAGRAVLSGAGQGLRQVQRRIKAWTGQSHRDLQRYSRVEDAMARMSAHRRDGGIDWAGLAGGAGFADQSHLGREVRRVTGCRPRAWRRASRRTKRSGSTACWASTSGGLTACRPRPVPADGKKPVSAALRNCSAKAVTVAVAPAICSPMALDSQDTPRTG